MPAVTSEQLAEVPLATGTGRVDAPIALRNTAPWKPRGGRGGQPLVGVSTIRASAIGAAPTGRTDDPTDRQLNPFSLSPASGRPQMTTPSRPLGLG
jgi:hypothetical protein